MKKVEQSKRKPSESKEGDAKNPRGIGAVVDLFILEIDSLESTLPQAMKSIVSARQELLKRVQSFVELHGKPMKRKNFFQIDPAHGSEFKKLVDRLNRSSAAAVLVPRSFLVALISQYDNS